MDVFTDLNRVVGYFKGETDTKTALMCTANALQWLVGSFNPNPVHARQTEAVPHSLHGEIPDPYLFPDKSSIKPVHVVKEKDSDTVPFNPFTDKDKVVVVNDKAKPIFDIFKRHDPTNTTGVDPTNSIFDPSTNPNYTPNPDSPTTNVQPNTVNPSVQPVINNFPEPSGVLSSAHALQTDPVALDPNVAKLEAYVLAKEDVTAKGWTPPAWLLSVLLNILKLIISGMV